MQHYSRQLNRAVVFQEKVQFITCLGVLYTGLYIEAGTGSQSNLLQKLLVHVRRHVVVQHSPAYFASLVKGTGSNLVPKGVVEGYGIHHIAMALQRQQLFT